jgi:dTDP-4-dehydrorhamnose reductase
MRFTVATQREEQPVSTIQAFNYASPSSAKLCRRMRAPLELWAGAECTINRVGDTYFDQVALTGHDRRDGDIERLVSLGIKAIRYGILWERTAPRGLACADFSLADRHLEQLKQAGIRVIAGLVHHGSGPLHTSLLDPGFAREVGAFAGAVAKRYPWIEDFTPINEPLTTARFSGLYGHWYPHARCDAAFLKALLHQSQATIGAMRAIRAITPHARLVQTEDIGYVYATPKMQYQADFENHRRFLSLDLLVGKVAKHHPLYSYIRRSGMEESSLAAIADSPCPPDLIGANYYVTSDRFLDESIAQYPERFHGSNGRMRYADVEAVRVEGLGVVGHQRLLQTLHHRYGLPLALTEVHLGCSEDEQVRWLWDAWRGALAARASGIDVQAVTLWSAFGAWDWNTLVTRASGHYESGAFDIRGDVIRATPVAAVARALAHTGSSSHPLLKQDGWWRRPMRVLYGAATPREPLDSVSSF